MKKILVIITLVLIMFYSFVSFAGYTLISNCDSSTSWVVTNGQRSIDTADKQEGTGSLKLITDAAVGEGYVSFDPAGTWDWSSELHFTVWLKGDTAESGELFIFKDGANYERWAFTYPTTWTLTSFDLSSPDSSGGSGNGDYSSIDFLRFDINAAEKTARYDYIRVDDVTEEEANAIFFGANF